MKKLLLTGANGFIGRHTIPFLLEKGYEVHAICIEEVTNPNPEPNLFWHQCDLMNAKEVAQVMQSILPTHLLHFAWYAVPGKFWSSPANMDWVGASLHIVKEFVNAGGKRMVLSGTCAEYQSNVEICCEANTPILPESLYGTCKASLQKIVHSYAQQEKISYAWGRAFFLYGPHEYKQRLVPNVILNLLNKEAANCSHGNQVRDFMHVEDVARAFAALLDSQVEGPINIASGQKFQLKDIICEIGNILNSKDLIRLGAIIPPANEPPIILANTHRLSAELHWSPRFTLQSGLQHTIDWWKRQLEQTTP